MRRRETISRIVSSHTCCDLFVSWCRSRDASIYLCLLWRAVYCAYWSHDTIYPDISSMSCLKDHTWLVRSVPSGTLFMILTLSCIAHMCPIYPDIARMRLLQPCPQLMTPWSTHKGYTTGYISYDTFSMLEGCDALYSASYSHHESHTSIYRTRWCRKKILL